MYFATGSTYNSKYALGEKITTIETKSFNCMINTAKEGLFKKQSMIFWDLSADMAAHRQIAKLLFHESLSSPQRIELHDIIAHVIDKAGMSGKSLEDTLLELFEGLKKKGVGFGTMLEDNIDSLDEKPFRKFQKGASPQKKVLLIYLICLLISFLYVPQYIYYEGKQISWSYTFIWSEKSPIAHIDLGKLFVTIGILTIIFAIIIILLPKK